MDQEKVPTRKIRELLRLKFDIGLSIHKIAANRSIARSTVTGWSPNVALPDFAHIQRELSRLA